MKNDHRNDTIGPWAKEKLEHLSDYLRFYCTYLKKQQFKKIYIDAFAGAPKARVRTSEPTDSGGFDDLDLLPIDREARQEFVLGSPHRALEIDQGFDFHYFFDLDETRVAKLASLKADYQTKHIDARQGDANTLVQQFADRIRGKRQFKGVAFLDPYGPQLAWETVKSLADTKAFEVIINFPAHMALNRLICVKPDERRPAWEDLVTKVMGDDAWRAKVYQTSHSLFGEVSEVKADGTPELLKDLYIAGLKQLFECVSEPVLIRNTHNAPLYYLIWAGPHPAGLKGANYILGQKKQLRLGSRG